jgi:hypothetical protein
MTSGAHAPPFRPAGYEGGAQAGEEIGFGAGSGEGQANAAGHFDDAGGDLEQFEAQRGELRLGHKSRAFGMASRTASISQSAAARKTSRTWLASAERRDVRSEASWVLCVNRFQGLALTQLR